MAFNNGTIGEIIKVLDMASVEMLAISLPDSRIIDVTGTLVDRWSCSKYNIVGHQLSQSPKNQFFAQYVSNDVTDISVQAKRNVEIVYTPNTGEKPVVTRFKPLHHRDGDSEFLLLIGEQPERARQSSAGETEARLELAVKAGGYAVWDNDFISHSANYSPEVHYILGYDPISEVLTPAIWEERVHPDDVHLTIKAQMSRTGTPDKYYRTQYRIRHKFGHYIWLELIASIIHDPLTNQPTKIIGLCRDVTDEADAVHRIETSEQNLARSQAMAKIGSWVMDIATGEMEWSAQMYALIGSERKDKPADFENLQSMMDNVQLEKWLESLEIAKSGQPIVGLECDITHPDGEIHRLGVHIDIEYDLEGNPAKLHGICQDITDQILLERKFLQAQKMESVGRLTGGIAHDFNNLLMVVLGNLQMIEKLTTNDERASKRLHTAIDAVNKGTELNKRLLAFSRQQTLEDSEIVVNELIDGITDMLEKAIGGAIELDVIHTGEKWTVKADVTQLETAILNLAINARDAMKDGGKLVVETSTARLDREFCRKHEDLLPGDYVVISVSDNGEGMSEDIIDKVIQPFFTTKPPEAGSGLGLSMIYGFVKQSKGHLDIKSKPGVGTTISIYLPKTKSSSVTPSMEETADLNKAISATDENKKDAKADVFETDTTESEKTPVVLIAEDNHPVRNVAVAMVEEMGYTVLDAPNGEEALELIRQRDDIDLLISDVVMPGMNGPELATEAMEIRPDLKVLFVSGYTQNTSEEIHELPNFIELIDKPFTQEELTSKVKKAIDSIGKDKQAA